MSDFSKRYAKLNPAQKQAVDAIEGPVMVVAGPGTGKTELLSVRVANILQKTDELPGNILCLTFTESGATAMRERLAGLIGADAYKVAIHTFHSFGSEIINQYGEYFYHGAYFRPADELSAYETLREIFMNLPHDNVLHTKMNGEFTYLRDTQSAISDLKKSGLTPDELLAIIDRNDAFCQWVQPKLDAVLAERLSKKLFPSLKRLVEGIANYSEEPLVLINYQPLSDLMHDSLERALLASEADGSTKPLASWKRQWCEKNDEGSVVLKDDKRGRIVRAVAGVYYEYLIAMQGRELYDFDDMILRVVHGVEVFNELRFNLQEQYHYVMVDEFQDTNDAQMRLVWNLTNSLVNEGRPNLMVVGDDDQAIYRFQGANISNILDFRELYRDVEVVTLVDNYRSSAPILDTSRRVIMQADERLETSIPELNKELTPHRPPVEHSVRFTRYESELQEYAAVAARLRDRDASKSYAIIARNHRQLRALLPYLQAEGLPLSYEAQENILENPLITHLELLARIVDLISNNRVPEANAALPQLLAHPAWGIGALELWELSVRSASEHKVWLEIMLETSGKLHDIAEWLLETARAAHHEPLEFMLDLLIGATPETIADNEMSESAEEDGSSPQRFISPLKQYHFDTTRLDTGAMEYAQFLYALRTLRTHLREYRPDQVLLLGEFIEFIELHHSLNLPIQAQRSTYGANTTAIELLTAHRSKGLEFDDVTIISLTDNVWGETARGRGRLVRFSHNLPIDAGGDTSDEKIRLLYVAITRARERLTLTTHETNDNGKPTPLVGYLIDEQLPVTNASTPSAAAQLRAEEIDWRAPIIRVSDGHAKNILTPLLEHYKLSATHLNNYLDVSRGGPESFLLHNLLRFPQAMSPSASYGSSIHATLQRAHQHLRATGNKRPLEDILGDFESELRRCYLSEAEFDHFLARGTDTLNAFLKERYDSFTPTQVAERQFGMGVKCGSALLSGTVDLIEVDEEAKTITVTDYKTGRATASWQGKADFEKMKLHHYRQQLIFYKLLLENSREYSGYTVTRGIIEYVEPTPSGKIIRLELDYDPQEVERVARLIDIVWHRIMALDFSLPLEGGVTYKDVITFENHLLQ